MPSSGVAAMDHLFDVAKRLDVEKAHAGTENNSDP